MASSAEDRGIFAAAEGKTTSEPAGLPAERPGEQLVIKSGAVFLCLGVDGEVRASRADGEGLYCDDTRLLSDLRLTLGGRSALPLSTSVEQGHSGTVWAANRQILDTGGQTIPERTLGLKSAYAISAGLYALFEIVSFHPEPVAVALRLELAADFADIFEVRGILHDTLSQPVAAKRLGDGYLFANQGGATSAQQVRVKLDPAPARSEVNGQRVYAQSEVVLEPQLTYQIQLTVTLESSEQPRVRRPFAQVMRDLERQAEEWTAAATVFETDDVSLQQVLAASMRDIRVLLTPGRNGVVPAAGIPWYVATFGRDALITAYQCLTLNPQIARDALLALATLQAKDDDPWRDAEPGKIPHELRCGELARAGLIPHTPYYGTADATPWFVMLTAALFDWTGELELLAGLRPKLDAALQWIDRYGDLDGDGFVEYRRRSPAGLDNQGWKDSPGAILHRDGTPARGPIALVEVQGYIYAAKRWGARVYDALGDGARADQLRTQAARLRRAFNDAFWDPEEQSFVLALDGRKAQVKSVTSNPGHCLFCGIVDEDKAAALAQRLMAPDMFCGWGVRTLSSASPGYNPMSYHNGSVWPHDNAIIAAGLKHYGYTEAAKRIASAILEVAVGAADHRLAELYCGFERREPARIVDYPVACKPQAWAAGTPFMLLQTLLGVGADATGRQVRATAPVLPDRLAQVDLRNLRVGSDRIELGFTGSEGVTHFSSREQRTTLAPAAANGTTLGDR